MKYRFVDHTADIAFEVYGGDLRELIKNATMAFYNAFVYTDKIKVEYKKEIEVEAESEDLLLFNWLNELLFIFDTEFFAGKNVDVNVFEDDVLRARGVLEGCRVDSKLIKVEPKAITFHNFKVERRNNEWYGFVIIDI